MRSRSATTSACTRIPTAAFGALSAEMWRAVRLVVDTGIHSKGWTREQAIDYFRANTALGEADIAAEVDRYIAWPGQALAYKVGQLEILELRRRAQQKLGPRFDIRAFHAQVLESGSLPLAVLEAKIDRWIAQNSGILLPSGDSPAGDASAYRPFTSSVVIESTLPAMNRTRRMNWFGPRSKVHRSTGTSSVPGNGTPARRSSNCGCALDPGALLLHGFAAGSDAPSRSSRRSLMTRLPQRIESAPASAGSTSNAAPASPRAPPARTTCAKMISTRSHRCGSRRARRPRSAASCSSLLDPKL